MHRNTVSNTKIVFFCEEEVYEQKVIVPLSFMPLIENKEREMSAHIRQRDIETFAKIRTLSWKKKEFEFFLTDHMLISFYHCFRKNEKISDALLQRYCLDFILQRFSSSSEKILLVSCDNFFFKNLPQPLSFVAFYSAAQVNVIVYVSNRKHQIGLLRTRPTAT